MALPKFEYVASGTSFLKIHYNDLLDHQPFIDYANEWFDILNNSNNHKFSLLYNAYTEKKYGGNIIKNHEKSIEAIYADSGGLQIITRAMNPSEKLRQKIYENQSNFSDYAMCFDEIPIKTITKTAGRNDVINKWFDIDNLKEYADATGRNIKNQINFFKSNPKNRSKPVIILHGRDYDSYMFWVDRIMAHLTDEDKTYIGAYAVSSASYGFGELEELRKFFYTSLVPIENKHIHILGLGAAARALPLMALIHHGRFDDYRISYDSTTHTNGVTFGRYFLADATNLKYPRKMDAKYNLLFEDIQTKKDMGIDITQFHRGLNTSYGECVKQGIDTQEMWRATVACICSSMFNFMEYMNHLASSKQSLNKELGSSYKLYETLAGVNTLEDFQKWEVDRASFLRSKVINDVERSTLEAFL